MSEKTWKLTSEQPPLNCNILLLTDTGVVSVGRFISYKGYPTYRVNGGNLKPKRIKGWAFVPKIDIDTNAPQIKA